MSGGFFGDLFDLNRDGKMDSLEKAVDFMAFNNMMESNGNGQMVDIDGLDDEEDVIEALEEAGLDYDELSLMDDDELIEALEDAGLDPDDFDL